MSIDENKTICANADWVGVLVKLGVIAAPGGDK
jgi:hypothetical protein